MKSIQILSFVIQESYKVLVISINQKNKLEYFSLITFIIP
jgi:hypothetical protein